MQEQTHSKQLKRRFTLCLAALLVTALAVGSAGYAWYVYNTGRHTTNVRMAAGTGANLQISNTYNGTYSSAAVLESFSGQLTPVSTNRISGGFQRVEKFTEGNVDQPEMVASVFQKSKKNDYYKTSLYLRTNGTATDVYLSGIGFEDSSEKNPISSAIRAGLVVYQPGETADDGEKQGEYIFAISDKKNPEAQYNTATGKEGSVLDCMKTDGTTVNFTPYTSEAYCIYDNTTGQVELKEHSLKLCTVSGTPDREPGTPVRIDLYIWLEGCDEDCTSNLCTQTLKNLAVSFAGLHE